MYYSFIALVNTTNPVPITIETQRNLKFHRLINQIRKTCICERYSLTVIGGGDSLIKLDFTP